MKQFPETLEFKKKYIKANQFGMMLDDSLKQPQQINEQYIEKKIIKPAIKILDEMIAMLPLRFTQKSIQWKTKDIFILLINLESPEDEPEEIYTNHNGWEEYSLPPNTNMLYESTIKIVLEDWKFRFLNTWLVSLERTSKSNLYYKYIKKVFSQAKKCIPLVENYEKDNLQEWQKNMISLYANQIAWYTQAEENDIKKLEKALQVLEKGYQFAGFRYSEWNDRSYIHDTKVRLLLKLNRHEEAFPIVYQTLKEHTYFNDFDDLKKHADYLKWLEKQKDFEEQQKLDKQKADEAFAKLLKEKQKESQNQFVNSKHTLVKKHKNILNKIKKIQISLRLRKLYYKNGWELLRERMDDHYHDDFGLLLWSEEKIDQYEKRHEIQLPEELKVYLMEIGEMGHGYFSWGEGIIMPSENKEIEKLKKNFPITSAKIHNIGSYLDQKGWIYPDDDSGFVYLQEQGLISESANAQEMFGLPENADIFDGCMLLGYSMGQNSLYLIMNGEFEGEIWSDALQYGVESGCCFSVATRKRLKFLDFIAQSLESHRNNYSNTEDGDWM
ncbi:hypothetical protein AD998_11680 [bacterium 336/3]|nr:hypothetical protein AD998_11680 [bacterium 336/3]